MSLVGYQLAGGAAHITLRAPERGNPLDPPMAADLLAAVRRARADDARVVVLRGEGRAFSFGGDVSAFAAADDPELLVDDLAETLHRTVSDLHRMDAVVVSVVHGTAAGAGVPLAAAADVVLAGASARFTLAYTKIGLSPDGAARC
jgi:2-(1,2-epoxy-1,2-dihydrophenyl)acetyl-CoA isomerase